MKSVVAAVVKASMSKKSKTVKAIPTMSERYKQALNLFQQNKTVECISECHALVRESPELGPAWHLIALCLLHLRKTAWALAAVKKALRIEPRAAHYWNTQGAILLERADRLGAIDAYQHVVAINPQMFDAFLNLAKVFHTERQWEQEQQCYQRILLQEQDHVAALMQYGMSLYYQTRIRAAISCFKRILRKDPKYVLARLWIGICMQYLDLTEEAIPCYQQVLRDDPKLVSGYINLGVAYKQKGEYENALICYRKALEYDPNIPYLYNNIGSALLKLERFAEAKDNYEKALTLNMNQSDAHNGLGYTWQMQNELDKAKACYEAAIALNPNYIEAHFNMATVLFMLGEYQLAWQEYAWRWQRDEMTMLRNLFRLPKWGGQSLQNKKILVFAEQGFGDNIQFVRYIPLLIVEGANVYLETYPELVTLFSGIKSLAGLFPRGTRLPNCDYMAPIISVAEFFTDDEASIPKNGPYLAPVGNMKPKLMDIPWDKSKKKIGICAEGKKTHRNNHNRSTDLASLIEIIKHKNRQLFSLQKPAPELELLSDIVDVGSWCDDFNDMAHAIDKLDLLITVDTSLAHLGGALNKPTWVLLPYVPDWRWQLSRTDSPWYPSVRLFRQEKPGDWASVLLQVQQALNELDTNSI